MTQIFERTVLYEEVWKTPLTKLGDKYGLSDNGIRKICKALAIPLPKAGHWARVAAGQVLERPQLPNHEGRDTFVSYAMPKHERRSAYTTPEDEQWLAERMAFETFSAVEVRTPLTGARWHPAIAPLHQAMVSAVKRYQEGLRERKAYRAKCAQAKNPGLNWEYFKWRYLDDGLLYVPHGPRTCLRVSIHTYQRALAIFNTLAKAASLRKCRVEVDNDYASVKFLLEGATLSAALRERQKAIAPTTEQSSATGAPAIERRLALVVSQHPGGEFQLVDGEKSLEDQLGTFFPRLYRAAVVARQRERENRAKELRQERDRAEAAALTAQQLALEAERQAAIEREHRLLQEAAEWRQAAEIRRYVESVCSMQAPSDITDWKMWALAVADKLDPLQNPESTFRLRW